MNGQMPVMDGLTATVEIRHAKLHCVSKPTNKLDVISILQRYLLSWSARRIASSRHAEFRHFDSCLSGLNLDNFPPIAVGLVSLPKTFSLSHRLSKRRRVP